MKTQDPERLVHALVTLGLSEERARDAVTQDRVALGLLEDALHAGRVHTAETVAAEAGLPLELLHAWEQALGVPSYDRYRDSDLEHARLLGQMVQMLPGLDVERVLRGLQADAQALRRMAMGDLQFVFEQFIQPVREEQDDEIAVAVAVVEAARMMLPIAGPLVGAAYKRVLEHLLSTELVAHATRGEGDHLRLAVGFVDVVGYTSLSARVDPSGLEEVIEAFETRCYTVAGMSDDVELTKFLGDAAMFVSVDPVTLAHALVELVETPEEDSPLAGTPMKAGMAYGDVLVRVGDYFGPPVNLAARLTDRARSGRLLVAEDLGDELEEHFRVRRAPPMHLRGLSRQRPYSVRTLDEDEAD